MTIKEVLSTKSHISTARSERGSGAEWLMCTHVRRKFETVINFKHMNHKIGNKMFYIEC